MTSFNSLFGQMFNNKKSKVNLLVLIQAVAALILAIWMGLSLNNPGSHLIDRWSMGMVVVGSLTPFVDMAYVVISSWQNEKYFSSQTWRLLPVNSSKFYLANLTSSIVNGLYLVLLQVILFIIALLPMFFFHEVRFNIWLASREIGRIWSGSEFWSKLFSTIPLANMISLLIGFFLFAILVYSFVTTVDLSSKTISDFMNDRYSKILRFIIVVALVIILFIIGGNLYNTLIQMSHLIDSDIGGIWVTNAAMIIIDLIFSGINIWLLTMYHEGK